MQKLSNLFILILLLLYSLLVSAQTKHGTFYFAFGTNLSFYSKSDIRLKSAGHPAFDITLYNVQGKDDGGINFEHEAPQYSCQIGYYKKAGVSNSTLIISNTTYDSCNVYTCEEASMTAFMNQTQQLHLTLSD